MRLFCCLLSLTEVSVKGLDPVLILFYPVGTYFDTSTTLGDTL